MKKVLHREFSYQIPEKSGFTPIRSQGLPGYIFVEESEFNQAELYEFLLKILSALHLEPGIHVEIIFCNEKNIYPIQELLSNQTIDLISFGVSPAKFHLQGFELIHNIYHYQNSRFLFANSLKSYSNEAAKKVLWTVLKKMFAI